MIEKYQYSLTLVFYLSTKVDSIDKRGEDLFVPWFVWLALFTAIFVTWTNSKDEKEEK